MHRRLGELVSFSLQAPGADSVALAGDLATRPLRAEKSGGAWTLTLPVSEGRYSVYWIVDGEPLRSADGEVRREVREVRPLEPIVQAYPLAGR